MDLRGLKDRAAALFSKKKFREAAGAYAELIVYEPNDPRVRIRYADACRRVGADAAAVGAYRIAAELYRRSGQWVCARATLRVAVEVDPRSQGLLDDLRRLEADAMHATGAPMLHASTS